MQKGVQIPPSGSITILQVVPGDTPAFAFSESKADYARDGANLVITADGGGGIVLENFFVPGDSGELPGLIMADGSEIPGGAFLKSINPDFDISTAAGPSTSSAQSSGAGDYDDAAGDLLGGLDRFGSLGTDFWSRETSVSEELHGTAHTGMVAGTSPAAGGDAPGPDGPSGPASYIARAVLYKTDAASSNTVRFRLLDENNDPVDPSASGVSFGITGDNGYFDLSSLTTNTDGALSATLTGEGLNALAAAGGGNLYEYLTVTVDGYEYRMQIVVNQSGDFNSADENADSNNGNSSGHEWHSESGGTGSGRRYGDNGDNEVWFEKNTAGEAAFTGVFTSRGGNDTLNIENRNADGIGMSGNAHIDGGSGQDSIAITGGFTGMGAIERGCGTNSIDNAGTVSVEGGFYGMRAGTVGDVNTIKNVAGDVSVTTAATADCGMYALYGGVNEIADVLGSVTVTGGNSRVAAGMYAAVGLEGESKNIIRNVDGDVNVTGSYSGMHGSTGTNEILHVGGDVKITGKHGMLTTHPGGNTIAHVEGDVIITGTDYDGISGHAGDNEVLDVRGDVIVTSGAGAYASGISSNGHELNRISGVDGKVAVTGAYYGLEFSSGGIQQGVGIEISQIKKDVEVTGGTLGMYARSFSGENCIVDIGGTVTVQNTSAAAAGCGMDAINGGLNRISGIAGDVNVISVGSSTQRFSNSAVGLSGKEGGTNEISAVAGNVAVTVTGSGASYAAGMSGNSASRNEIFDIAKSVDIRVESSDDIAYGMFLKRDADNRISSAEGNKIAGIGGNVTINAESVSKAAYGMAASGGRSSNKIENVEGEVLINAASAAAKSYGLFADYGGSNEIAGAGGVSVSGGTYGMYSHTYALENWWWIGASESLTESGNTIRDIRSEVVVQGGEYGMYAYASTLDSYFPDNKHDAESGNRIENVGGSVTLGGGTYGMYARAESIPYDDTAGNTPNASVLNCIGNIVGDVTVTGGEYGMYATAEAADIYTASGENRIENAGGTVTVAAESASGTTYAMYAVDGGRNTIDNSASEAGLTLILKVSNAAGYALYAAGESNNASDPGKYSANTIIGSSRNDSIDITGKIYGNNIINTGAGNDFVMLSGSVSGLVVDMGDGYDTLVLKAAGASEFNGNYETWLTGLLAGGGHGIESIQVDGFTSLADVPDWLGAACRENGVDFSLYGGEVDAAGAQDHSYEADHSYLVTVDGNEADGQTVVLNNGHDRVELTGSVGHGADVAFNTANGNDYAQAHDADLGAGFALDMGNGNDVLSLSGNVNIASGATFSGGAGHDALHIGNLTTLNGTDVSAEGDGLSLSRLGGILDGFEVLDMTGGNGSSLLIDVDSLVALGIGSADLPSFNSSGAFDVNVLESDNVLLIKGDAGDSVEFFGTNWNGTGNTVTADGIDYAVYSNDADEYILVQQIVSVTG